MKLVKLSLVKGPSRCLARAAPTMTRFSSHMPKSTALPLSEEKRPSSRHGYLDTLSSRDLLSYLCIGAVTINKPILNFVIKLFPYVPLPIIKAFVSRIYCGGDTAAETVATGHKLAERGIQNMMISFTLEDAEGTKDLDINYIVNETIRSVDEILIPHTEAMMKRALSEGRSVDLVPAGYVALKPSALVANPAAVMKHYKQPEYAQGWSDLVNNSSRIVEHIYKRNAELAQKYPKRTVPVVVAVMDAEKYDLQQSVYELQRMLFKKYNPLDRPACMVGTVQMYLKQSLDVLKHEQALAEKEGYKIGMKLVRGAYIHTELDRGVIHDTKEDTDICYDAGMELAVKSVLAGGSIDHVVVASHNGESMMKATRLIAQQPGNIRKYHITLAQLLGMADDITYDLINNRGVTNIIKYVPWGPPKETKDYLLRRLEENGDAVRNDNGLALVIGVLRTLSRRVFSV